ncbi:MAG: ComEA family DNA-binding protein [Deltaproteobacteria bacterium]
MNRWARFLIVPALCVLFAQALADEPRAVGKININTASAAQLDSLPYVGEKTAEKIIEYRRVNGGFKTVEEIKNVKGIGDKKFERIKNLISVN